MGFTGPSVVRQQAEGYVPAAVTCGSRWVPSSIANEGIDMFGCDRSHRSGLGCFVPLALEAAAWSAPRNFSATWRGGDWSPPEMNWNYAPPPALSSGLIQRCGWAVNSHHSLCDKPGRIQTLMDVNTLSRLNSRDGMFDRRCPSTQMARRSTL